MIRVHVICEGQTEEEFIRYLLSPVLVNYNVTLLPSCIGKVGHKRGNVNLNRLVVDLRERLLNDKQCYCTTLLDYYGLPSTFPGKIESSTKTDIVEKQSMIVQALSSSVRNSLGDEPVSRFIPYIQMFEFEGLLFSEPTILAKAIDHIELEPDFQKIRSSFETPEWINDDPHSAPSKRIQKLFEGYDKPKHPLLAALDIGLDNIRQECTLFNTWVQRLEDLGSTGGDA